MSSSAQPAIIVHGGAWDIPQEVQAAHQAGCRRAAEAGWEVLRAGGSAVDAVEAAIVVMEDDETFDAGRGSHLNAAGEVELDAGFMDGQQMLVGGVAAVKGIRNPIRLARAVMERSEHVLIVAEGARRFAERLGVETCPPSDLVVPRELERWRALQAQQAFHARQAFSRPSDTVGAVAVDGEGRVAAGTSTGGTPHKMPGRVGDVPMVGCGFYADAALGGASSTGWGESIAKVILARLALHRLQELGDPQAAAQAAIQELGKRVGGLGGVILLAPDGRPGWHYNTPHMAYAYRRAGMPAAVVGL